MAAHDHLDNWILFGPAKVELELGKYIQPSDEPYLKYRYLLQAVQTRKPSANLAFLTAHFHREAGLNCSSPAEKETHFKASLSHYEAFLDAPKNGNADLRYFAQWQRGLLLQVLGHPWPLVEETFLAALEYDQTRGEAFREILNYRCTREEWRIAYIYSSYCIRQFLGKRPLNRHWQVDDSFYNWEILRYHLPVLVATRNNSGARAQLDQLEERLHRDPNAFTEKDRLSIMKLKAHMEEAMLELAKI